MNKRKKEKPEKKKGWEKADLLLGSPSIDVTSSGASIDASILKDKRKRKLQESRRCIASFLFLSFLFISSRCGILFGPRHGNNGNE